MKTVRLLYLVLAVVCTGGNVGAETLYLSVAASMTDAFTEIAAGFSAAHPDDRLLPNFASSGSLAKQIEQGAPADVYVSANPEWMAYLAREGMVEPRTVRIFSYNCLVFIGIESKVGELAELAGLERIALGSPSSVPAGQYARQAMENGGVYMELLRARKFVMAKDVRQALLYADRGEVDGAFVYRTDALLARNASIIFAVPGDLHDPIVYPVGLTRQGMAKTLARDFYSYMSGPQATEILKQYGFEPVLPEEPGGRKGASCR